MAELGRVVDPEALERADGRRGRMTVSVLAEWLARGDTIEVAVPNRLLCARCNGGGCDGCDRSGAVKLTASAEARVVRVALPKRGSAPLLVRLVRPFGEHGELAQLVLEIRVAGEASSGCRRATAERERERGASVGVVVVAVGLALALAAAVSFAIR